MNFSGHILTRTCYHKSPERMTSLSFSFHFLSLLFIVLHQRKLHNHKIMKIHNWAQKNARHIQKMISDEWCWMNDDICCMRLCFCVNIGLHIRNKLHLKIWIKCHKIRNSKWEEKKAACLYVNSREWIFSYSNFFIMYRSPHHLWWKNWDVSNECRGKYK